MLGTVMPEVPLAGPELGGLQREAQKAGAPPQTPEGVQEAEEVGGQERVQRDEQGRQVLLLRKPLSPKQEDMSNGQCCLQRKA